MSFSSAPTVLFTRLREALDSWTQVMLGQGIQPRSYHHAARILGEEELKRFLADYRASITQTVARMPGHQEFVNQYCKASNSVWN